MKLKKWVVTLSTVALLSMGGTSAFAAISNWETEPNTLDNPNFAVPYNLDQAVNRGFISSTTDVDHWNSWFNLNTDYEIALQSPDGGYDYNFTVYEKINGELVEIARSTGDFYENDYVTIPGLKPDGIVPQYIIAVYSQYYNIYTPDKNYNLVIRPINP